MAKKGTGLNYTVSDTNAAIGGALLGTFHGAQSIPLRWSEAILNCRPDDRSCSRFPRPDVYWPCDIDRLAVQLLTPESALSQ